MYIYIFGSFVRGEIDNYSDIDLLLILQNESKTDLDPNKFSIYTLDRIKELWNEGNPFAWHLYHESKLIFSNNDNDIIKELGKPSVYKNLKNDLIKFKNLFDDSLFSYYNSDDSKIFDLSMIFLSIRNFASCYCLGKLNKINFSRNSSLKLDKLSLKISEESFLILQKARILSTRGNCDMISNDEFKKINSELDEISQWFNKIYNEHV